MLFILDFADNIILPCFFFFFLTIDLYLSILELNVKILNSIAEVAISIGMPSKEAKAEIEIQPVIVESRTRKCSNII